MDTIIEESASILDIQRGYLPEIEDLAAWEYSLSIELYYLCLVPVELCIWDLYTLTNGGFFWALIEGSEDESFEVRLPPVEGKPSQCHLSVRGASLLLNLLYFRSVATTYKENGNVALEQEVRSDLDALRDFVATLPAGEDILACFDCLTRPFPEEQTTEIVERAMDAFLLDNDLRGASALAGDRIVDIVWHWVERIAGDGIFQGVPAIVERACLIAEREIEEILKQDWADQQELEDEEEECDA